MSFCTLLGLFCWQAAIWEGKVCDRVSSHLSFTLAPAAGPFSMARVKYQRVWVKYCSLAFPYWEVSVKLWETQLTPPPPRMAWRAHVPLRRTQELCWVQRLPLLGGNKRTEILFLVLPTSSELACKILIMVKSLFPCSTIPVTEIWMLRRPGLRASQEEEWSWPSLTTALRKITLIWRETMWVIFFHKL